MAPTNQCAGCNKALPKKEYLTCCVCKHTYDIECANVSTKRFLLMEQRHKTSWICPACHCKEPKVGNTNTPIRSYEAASVEEDSSNNVTTKAKKDYDKSLIGELQLFRVEMEAMRQEMSKFSAMFGNLSQSIDCLNMRVESLENRVTAVEAQGNTYGVDEIKVLNETVDRLKLELNERDQELLSMDVEISGLPEVSGESPTHLTILVAKKLGVDLETRDVVSAERTGMRRSAVEGIETRPRSLAVRLARRSLRDELIRAARRERGADTSGFDLPGPPRRFYVNERLTRTNRQLFYEARKEGIRLKWRFIWTREGRIYVRRQSETTAHRIRSIGDITKVFGVPTIGS